MAWIESHQDLKDHPKVADLMAAMEWDLDTALGKLHRFWWWCVDYAEDGDLRKHNDNRIAQAMGVANADARRLVEAMVTSCWIDRAPYFRVHDWWDYFGLFLQRKYSGPKHTAKWERIKALYADNTATAQLLSSPTEPNQPTNQTNQTIKGSLHAEPTVNGKRLAELLSLCKELLGPEEMARWHKRWYERASTNGAKLGRVLAEVKSAVVERRIKKTPAAYAEQIWKEFP